MPDINITHLPKDETLQAGLSAIANVIGSGSITVDTEMSDTSTNAVQNKVIKRYVDGNSGVLPFVVNMIFDGTNLTADKTFGEIKTAADNNKLVFLKTVISGETDTTATNLLLDCTAAGSTIILAMVSSGEQSIKTLTGTQNEYPTITLGG